MIILYLYYKYLYYIYKYLYLYYKVYSTPNPLKSCAIWKYMNISYYINHNIQGIKKCTLIRICDICMSFLDQMTKCEVSVQNSFALYHEALTKVNEIVVIP